MNLPGTRHFGLLLWGVALGLHAEPAAVQQLQNDQFARSLQTSPFNLRTGTNAPQLFPGEDADVGPQQVLRLNPRKTYFEAVLDSQVYFSDNANYAQSPDAIASPVFVNAFQALFTPPAVELRQGSLSGSLGLASQWYNYGDNRLTSLDFNALTLSALGKYTLDSWQLNAGLNVMRMVDQGNYQESYREAEPTLGVQRLFPITDHLTLVAADTVDYHFTEVPSLGGSPADINDRFDNTASLTLNWQITQRLLLQPFYRFQSTHYRHDTLASGERNDSLQGAGCFVTYYFNQNVSLRTFYNYSRKQSDDALTPQYHEMNGGLGLSLDVHF